MEISRREFLHLMGCLVGGWILGFPGSNSAKTGGRLPAEPEFGVDRGLAAEESPGATATPAAGDQAGSNASGQITDLEAERILAEAGRFDDLPAERYFFDESKYSALKRQLPRSEWSATNRHLPIQIDSGVINRPGERSPEALMRVLDYTQFYHPRYVAQPGERVTMCNIAAWDWSRAMQVHLPHWMGETEMSANMLFRWVSHAQAGGVHGEGWQPVEAVTAQLLANRGVPVFALAENPRPSRHGHVAMVYPTLPTVRSARGDVHPHFATVKNGRSRTSNGIKNLRDTFRWMTPTYFVHKSDFIVHQSG